MGKHTTYINSLSIDITRRCNMQCTFCCKGDAQNQTITKQIVDKLFDELQDCAIGVLRLFGGEPMLEPDMVTYIIEQARKRLMFGDISINTNGTIYDDNIKDALTDTALYLRLHKQTIDNVFAGTDSGIAYGNVILEISTENHDPSNIDHINSIEDSWRTNGLSNYLVLRDSDRERYIADNGRQSVIALKGNTLKNHKKLLPQVVDTHTLSVDSSTCDFIFDTKTKTKSKFKQHMYGSLSVSTNGNIYNGCGTSWDDIDNDPMFNIMDCNGNFVDHISKWCWDHPGNIQMKLVKDEIKTRKWLVNHGYTLTNIDIPDNMLDRLDKCMQLYNRVSRYIHSRYPDIGHTDVDMLSCAWVTIVLMKVTGKSWGFVEAYLRYCTLFRDDFIDAYKERNGIVGFLYTREVTKGYGLQQDTILNLLRDNPNLNNL